MIDLSSTAVVPRACTARLVEELRRPSAYPHPAGEVQVVETHISYVLLAGDFAYKIKKPVRLPFLDFSTLHARRYFCEEEVRLNGRAAPRIYLGVVAIGGEPPAIGSAAQPVEYAVKMRRFPQEALLDHLLREGLLQPAHVDALAHAVARLHAEATRAEAFDAHESVVRAVQPALDNFHDIAALEPAAAHSAALERLRQWTLAERDVLARRFAQRRLDGFVRECHGDLHLANVVLLDGQTVPYDCIEFDPRMRWIDVMSDVAFAMMDLVRLGAPRLAARFLNAYLEETGDYAGLRVLRFYLVYRAMVRAKIMCLRAAHDDFAAHLALAERLSRPAAPVLVLMHGLSGSGKTTAAQVLVEALGAIRLRSDVERKRLHGRAVADAGFSAPGAGLYTQEVSAGTYARLAVLADEVLAAGFPVIVDAASLMRAQRDRFRQVARAAGAAFELATCAAPGPVLRGRIEERTRAGHDASRAGLEVLALQAASCEPLGDDERRHCVTLDTTRTSEWKAAAESLARRFHAFPE